jgi:hypothetical protein
MISRLRKLPAVGLAALALLAHAPVASALDEQACDPADLAVVDAWLAAHPWRTGTPQPDQRIAAACKLLPLGKKVRIVATAFDIGRVDRGQRTRSSRWSTSTRRVSSPPTRGC